MRWKATLWIAICFCQILGVVVPTYGTIHGSVAPLFAYLLLAPGILVWLFLNLPYRFALGVAIPINLLFWHFLLKYWTRARSE